MLIQSHWCDNKKQGEVYNDCNHRLTWGQCAIASCYEHTSRSRLGSAVRLWVEHVCSHCQDDADMLLPHSTSTTDSSFTWTWCRCKTRLRICHLAVGLLQRYAGWTATVNDGTIAARVKFCCSSGARSSTTRSRHCSIDRPTLATSLRPLRFSLHSWCLKSFLFWRLSIRYRSCFFHSCIFYSCIFHSRIFSAPEWTSIRYQESINTGHFQKHLKTFLFCKHYGTIFEQ